MDQKITKITYDDFAKVEIKAGKILSAGKVPDTDKLLKLSVDLGEATPRQIISGIAAYFPTQEALASLVGRTTMFVTNLEPRTIRGLESNGMLFAISAPAVPATPATSATDGSAGSVESVGAFSLLEPGAGISPGTRAK